MLNLSLHAIHEPIIVHVDWLMDCGNCRHCHKFTTKSIEWGSIDDKSFSTSYDSAPHPPLPLSFQKVACLSFSVFLCVAGRGRGWGVGGGAKSYDDEKAWSSIIHSMLSGVLILSSSLQHRNISWRGTRSPSRCQQLMLGTETAGSQVLRCKYSSNGTMAIFH